MSVAQLSIEHINSGPKRAKVEIQPTLSFSDKDKIGTIQPHDDALVLTLKIGGYDVKRVLLDQGSGIEIMYRDLYKGLNLTDEDLTTYNSPLVSFEGKIVIPKGQIRLLVQAGSEVVEMEVSQCFLPLHGHSCQTLASRTRGCFFNSVLEGEIPVRRPD